MSMYIYERMTDYPVMDTETGHVQVMHVRKYTLLPIAERKKYLVLQGRVDYMYHDSGDPEFDRIRITLDDGRVFIGQANQKDCFHQVAFRPPKINPIPSFDF